MPRPRPGLRRKPTPHQPGKRRLSNMRHPCSAQRLLNAQPPPNVQRPRSVPSHSNARSPQNVRQHRSVQHLPNMRRRLNTPPPLRERRRRKSRSQEKSRTANSTLRGEANGKLQASPGSIRPGRSVFRALPASNLAQHRASRFAIINVWTNHCLHLHGSRAKRADHYPLSRPHSRDSATQGEKDTSQRNSIPLNEAGQIGFDIPIGEQQMPLVTLVLTLIVVGVVMWLINRFIPMQGQIKGILNGVVVIAVVLWLLKVFGLFGYLTQFRVGNQ
jgi:hypothetical protein